MDWLWEQTKHYPERGFTELHLRLVAQIEQAMAERGITYEMLAAKADLVYSKGFVALFTSDDQGHLLNIGTLNRIANALDMKLVVRLEPRDDDTEEAEPC
jgi:hypothetical protein